MKCAEVIATLSKANRRKVGCILVAGNGGIIAEGYNGTVAGLDNACEDENGKTKPEVLHAESNCISKVARSSNSSLGSTMYCTLSPCLACAKLVIQAGVRRLVFRHQHYLDGEKPDMDGLNLLGAASIEVVHLP